MQLLDVTAETEGTFLRCLHDEAPDDPRIIIIDSRIQDLLRGLDQDARCANASQVAQMA
jgi:hypothetical protein